VPDVRVRVVALKSKGRLGVLESLVRTNLDGRLQRHKTLEENKSSQEKCEDDTRLAHVRVFTWRVRRPMSIELIASISRLRSRGILCHTNSVIVTGQCAA